MLAKLLAVLLLTASATLAQDEIRFQRHFPGAEPEHFEVSLDRDGSAVYTVPDEEPLELEVGVAEAEPVFELASQLDYFSKPLASKRKVASTGKKRLRYLSAGEVRGEAEFDYSELQEAREIASWFVRLAETRNHLQALERALRFDRLGVNQALVQLEQAFERDRIVAPNLLKPILGQIAQQPRVVHLARARAEGMLERIQAREH